MGILKKIILSTAFSSEIDWDAKDTTTWYIIFLFGVLQGNDTNMKGDEDTYGIGYYMGIDSFTPLTNINITGVEGRMNDRILGFDHTECSLSKVELFSGIHT